MGTAPYFAYGAVYLTNSDSALDNISSNGLHHNDLAVVLENNQIYFFKLDSDSGEDHDPPYIIKPTDSDDDKRWMLISQKYYNTDIVQLVENYIQTSHIKAIDDNKIEIESDSGQKIRVDTDGTVSFPSTVSASEPIESSHLTTKQYTDDEYTNKQDELESHIDTRIDNIEDEIKTYTDGEIDTLDTELTEYIDTELSELETRAQNHVDTVFNDKESNLTEYIDTEISDKDTELTDYIDNDDKYQEIKDYSNDEVERVVDSVYPILKFTVDSWISDNDLYYHDIEHNKGKYQTIIRCWNENNEMIYPYNLESIDEHTVRIWMTTDKENITMVIL